MPVLDSFGNSLVNAGNNLLNAGQNAVSNFANSIGLGGLVNKKSGPNIVAGPLLRGSSVSGIKADWRCKLTWPGAETKYLTGPFAYLPSFNSIVWPYTPQVQINYQASYEMIKTLQTNFGTPAYQSSEISSISISGEFTASTFAEANYLYAVIHFLKSATKGFNFNDEAAKTGSPPPILNLTYLGDAGINNMPVVIQQFNVEYPKDVDYIKTNFNPPHGITSLVSGDSMVPSEMQITIAAVPAYSRAKFVNADYSTSNFIKGDLLQKGYF